jgi:hypothetical protein
MVRTTDPAVLIKAAKTLPKVVYGFDPSALASNPDNIILVSGEDVGLLEGDGSGVFTGHYLFVSRGKAAKETARDMLAFLFDNYDAKIVKGLTPTDHKGALRLTKELGFTSHGVIETYAGPMELSTCSRTDLKDNP